MTPPTNGMLGGPPTRDLNSGREFADGFTRSQAASPELRRFLAEIKGQAQFLLYLADQIEESLDQLGLESDQCHGAFVCKVLAMYSNQLETKHQGLGEKIAEACQELYVTVREHELS